jgi:hypothetical protein
MSSGTRGNLALGTAAISTTFHCPEVGTCIFSGYSRYSVFTVHEGCFLQVCHYTLNSSNSVRRDSTGRNCAVGTSTVPVL